MSILKLNTLIGIIEAEKPKLKAMVNDYAKFFNKQPGKFKGERKTYVVEGEAIDDDPSKRANVLVTTTVDEKLSWFLSSAEIPIDLMLSQEATNASGKAKAHLMVGEVDFGEFSSLELLRLKSMLEKEIGNLYEMFANIPVRSDAIDWKPAELESYKGRSVFEAERAVYKEKTTNKESYILPDPNAGAGRPPQVAVKTITVILGESTRQEFSGEWTSTQRAELLKRYNTLQSAIVKALKEANDTDIVEVNVGLQILTYLFRG